MRGNKLFNMNDKGFQFHFVKIDNYRITLSRQFYLVKDVSIIFDQLNLLNILEQKDSGFLVVLVLDRIMQGEFQKVIIILYS